MKKGKLYFSLLGAVTGLANGFFGSGGGIIAVPMLESAEMEEKNAHAASLALTLPLSAVSMCFYAMKGTFELSKALPLILPGLAGAAAGSFWLRKISNKWLRRIFGAFLIFAGGRMLFQ